MQSVVTFFLWAFGSKTVIPGVVDAPILVGGDGDGVDGVKRLGKVISDVGMGGKVKGEESVQEIIELRGEEGELRGHVGTLPCVVFTHGMAGMSQSYSHYLGSIASHGYVVAAVEHRDGSGPGTIVHRPDGKQRYVWHVQLQDMK